MSGGPAQRPGAASGPASGTTAEDAAALRAAIEEARGLLQAHGARADNLPADPAPLPSLLEQARALQAEAAAARPEPIRTLHHFACTGGSLFSRILAAGPNARLLSEIDPLSRHMIDPDKPMFAPTDLIRQLHHSFRGIETERIAEIFLGALEVLARQCRTRGERLILRDHAHSHYCHVDAMPERPTLHALAGRVGPVLGAVTVRDPLQSWLALTERGWVHFEPATPEEYARRYIAFLDDHAGLPVFRYEDLVAAPEAEMARLSEALALPFDPMVLDLIGAVRVTGDSGRTGDRIVPRPPRDIPPDLVEAAAGGTFRALRTRLGYDG